MNSFNHYAYGSVAAWMYRTVCGIRYDEENPAYKHFFIEPVTDARLGSAKAKLTTRYGDIISEWNYESDGSVRYSFTVPENTTATLILGEKTEILSPGKYTKYTT
jgi:alpha-L-rhamnosidase